MLLKNYETLPDSLLEYWHLQSKISKDRNSSWFPSLIKFPKYKMYTVITNNEDIVAFSMIQTMDFPYYTCRIGTRSFIDPKYRNYTASVEKNKETPIFNMLKSQYQWVVEYTDKENCFCSMEFGKTAALKSSAKKFNALGIDAKVLPHLYQMLPDIDHPSCYQSVMLFPIKNQMFDLNYIERQTV